MKENRLALFNYDILLICIETVMKPHLYSYLYFFSPRINAEQQDIKLGERGTEVPLKAAVVPTKLQQ